MLLVIWSIWINPQQLKFVCTGNHYTNTQHTMFFGICTANAHSINCKLKDRIFFVCISHHQDIAHEFHRNWSCLILFLNHLWIFSNFLQYYITIISGQTRGFPNGFVVVTYKHPTLSKTSYLFCCDRMSRFDVFQGFKREVDSGRKKKALQVTKSHDHLFSWIMKGY